jgi:hypothetical protein
LLLLLLPLLQEERTRNRPFFPETPLHVEDLMLVLQKTKEKKKPSCLKTPPPVHPTIAAGKVKRNPPTCL